MPEEVLLKDTTMPTILFDSDSPPYFDDPGEESKYMTIMRIFTIVNSYIIVVLLV